MFDIMDDFIAAAKEDQQDAYRQITGKPDWIFRRVPPIPERLYPDFMAVIGQTDIHWIQKTQIKQNGAIITYGTAMFSPAAKNRVLSWLKNNR